MALTLADAFVRIRPDLAGFPQELQTKAELGAGAAGKHVGKEVAGGIVEGIAGVFAAEKIVEFFKDAFKEAQEAAKVTRLTEAAITSTGGAAHVSAEHIKELADSQSALSGVDDKLIHNSENVLLTFTRVRNEVGKGNDIFDQGTQAALDLSAALGTDLQAATILVGKALNDPIGGLTALKKAGVQLTDQQKEQIKTMVGLGDVMGAQKVILGELTSEFGGAAAAAASPADKATVAWHHFEEEIGNQLLPMLNDIINFGLANEKWLLPMVKSIAELGVVVGAVVVAEKGWAITQSVLGIGLEGNIGKIKRSGAALAGLLVVAQAVGSEFHTDLNPDVEKLAENMQTLADTSTVGAEATRLFGKGMSDLGAEISAVSGAGGGFDQFVLKTQDIGASIVGQDGPLKGAKERVTALDTALAQLASSGHADIAAAAFKKIWEQAQAAGVPLDKLQEAFPLYVAAAGKASTATGKLADQTKKAADAGKSLLDTWNELNGTMLDADHAALAAQTAIDGLTQTFKDNGKAIAGNSTKALTNKVALEDAAKAAADASAAYLENGGTADGAAAMMAAYEAAAIKATGATGKNKDAVKALADQLFKLPPAQTVDVNVNIHTNGAAQANAVLKNLALHGIGLHDGGVVKFFAQGGLEDHVAQIVKAGTLRVFGEPETGGEAYIPLGANKRARSTAVLSDVAKRFGYALVPTATGVGVKATSAGAAAPAAVAAAVAPRSPLHIEHYYAAPDHSESRLAQELDWLSRGGG